MVSSSQNYQRGISVLWIVILILIFFAILGLGLWYFVKSQLAEIPTSNSPELTSKEAEADLDTIIKKYVLSGSAPTVKDLIVLDKKIITDKEGTEWLKFNVKPLPEGVTDPAYGVMEKVGEQWQGIGFGTCCVEDNLSIEVGEALGFNMNFKKKETKEKNRTYTNKEYNFSLEYPPDDSQDVRKWEVNEHPGSAEEFASLTWAEPAITSELKSTEEKIIFSVADNPSGLLAKDWAKTFDYSDGKIEQLKSENADFEVVEEKALKVSELDSYQVKTKNEAKISKKITAFVPYKGKMFAIKNLQNDQHFSKILSSFKFN